MRFPYSCDAGGQGKTMNAIKKVVRFIFMFLDKMQRAHIAAYASQAAYFTVLSGIPLMMMMLALIQYTPLSEEMLLELLSSVFPSVIMPFVERVMGELYTKSVALISITAIVAFWSAARCVLAITAGFNSIYGKRETRNYFVLRFRASFQVLLFLIAVVFAMLLIVFSEQRLEFLGNTFPVLENLMVLIGSVNIMLTILVEFLMFLLIYKFLPNRKGKLEWQIPGALFAAIGWSAFSHFFSAYIGGFSNMSYMYGSLTTIIVFMLWIYFCMYILLIGAQINACVEKYPRWRKWEKFRKEKADEEKRRKKLARKAKNMAKRAARLATNRSRNEQQDVGAFMEKKSK